VERNPITASRVFTISFPEDLAQQVEQVAREESRNISELFREAFRTYRVQRAHLTLDKLRSTAQKHDPTPYTQDDIEGFVDEVRSKLALRRKGKIQKAAV
jgi:predicted transcriptional regulator